MDRTRNPRRRRLSPGVEALDSRQLLSGGVIGGWTAGLPGRFLAAVNRLTNASLVSGTSARVSTLRRPGLAALVDSSPRGRVARLSPRPHPLRLRSMRAAAAVPSIAPITPPTTIPSTAQAIVDLTNQYRAEAGEAPLSVSPALTTAAELHSQDMARLDQMSHDLAGVPLATPTDRAAYVHYAYRRLGENIAFNQPDAASVAASWMNSPPHRANMLDPSFTQIGVGVARNLDGELFYTMMLGLPS